ncbi:MAG: bifunctional 5,10-methylenetetrahydrofolate dehydrogenase/5,10-methenyltetrahydrofolate cyclohydrolase [Chloroflexi bacterium]|nr:bifunctional 5,10-methylenetetrahydrofolate dehydrogenase/5,10-methenyltetrahydrofolate cyclohydrolase [Chloroflexota bacterium]
MTAKLLDGRAIARDLKVEIAEAVRQHVAGAGAAPCLSVVLAGEDPASQVYLKRILSSCRDVGIESRPVLLPGDVPPAHFERTLRDLSDDPTVHGILVFMPLPAQLSQETVIQTIDPRKDVDGISPTNAGLLALGRPRFVPSTPLGGLELLKRYGVPLAGARAVVVGRSNVVGRPMLQLLILSDATVTVCHSRTKNLAEVTRQADILVAAIGRAGTITAEMVKPGAAVVDFGINPIEGGIVGDVAFGPVAEVAARITPVPGGTGPMTNMMLMRSTLEAARALDAAKIAGKRN